MTKRMTQLAAAFAALAALAPLPAAAEFLAPDWSSLRIKGVAAPDWIAGVREGSYIGLCTSCDGNLMLQVQTVADDGTGERVRSGQTSAQTYTDIGQANAKQMGHGAAYYGTEAVDFASAVGFKTRALTAAGDYSTSYQLWSDGQQLVVKVYGKDQARVDRLADTAYAAAAPLTFR
ncbi:hypothetical protein [uncultured Devosia sp.]|uniref:hypothetical protein n=1 Tax=uncultured Devosia sp. TaxID=211434 RepID=UPI0035CB1B28